MFSFWAVVAILAILKAVIWLTPLQGPAMETMLIRDGEMAT
jgi:hypothetical protein